MDPEPESAAPESPKAGWWVSADPVPPAPTSPGRGGVLAEIVVFYLALMLVALSAAAMGFEPDPEDLDAGELLGAQVVVAIGSVFLVRAFLGWRDERLRDVGCAPPPRGWRHACTVGVIAGLVIKVLSIGVGMALLGLGLEAGDVFFELRDASDLGVFAFGGALAGFSEELVYRGYLLSRLESVFARRGEPGSGLLWATCATSLVFGSGHAYQGAVGVGMTASVGVLLTLLVVLARRNLVVAMVAHAVFNLCSFLFVYAVS